MSKPEGTILFRWKPGFHDNITGYDDLPVEYAVEMAPEAEGGIVIWGLHPGGEWMPNWQARHLVARMLGMLQEIIDQHNEPCRLDGNGFCQSHFCGSPCVYGDLRKLF